MGNKKAPIVTRREYKLGNPQISFHMLNTLPLDPGFSTLGGGGRGHRQGAAGPSIYEIAHKFEFTLMSIFMKRKPMPLSDSPRDLCARGVNSSKRDPLTFVFNEQRSGLKV